MKKKTFWTLLLMQVSLISIAQKYAVEKSNVGFFSTTTLEDIKASNSKGASIFNTSTSEIVFSIPISEFEFDKSLMKEHFNEKYMETEKYPKAKFQGSINGFDPARSRSQIITASGKLTMHGITKEVEIPGAMEVKNSRIEAGAKFIVKLADYQITIPQLMWQNIADQVEVTLAFTYKPL